MRHVSVVLGLALVLAACGSGDAGEASTSAPSPPTTTTTFDPSTNLELAEAFIDAFYSYDPEVLGSMLSASSSKPDILFYQGWAEGANYAIVDRGACEAQTSTIVECPITVEDDLAKTLQIGFNVTDTFTLTIADGTISTVRTSSDDPAAVGEAFEWVFQQNPDLRTGVCEGLFGGGGPTPQDCAREVLAGLVEFAARNE